MSDEQTRQLADVLAQVAGIQETLDDLGFSFTKKTGNSPTRISGMPVQSSTYTAGISGWSLLPNGDAEFNSGTFRGSLIAGSIDIPNLTTASSFHVDNQGNAWWGATALGSAVAKILKTGIATFTNINITGGSVLSAVLNTSVMRATSDIVFSVTDNDTIAWTSGSIRNAAGTVYSIVSGNTGNMAALSYLYLDTAVSLTVLQITTSYSTAVGDGKILVATAQNQAAGGAYCIPFLGQAPLINGAAQINASSILAAQISVSQLSAITANLGTITAGTITLDTAGYIRGGATDYLTGVGIFFGYSGAAYKMSIGDPAGDYLAWSGTELIISGGTKIDIFTASGTWTKATAAKLVQVHVFAAGGGSAGGVNSGGAGTGGGGGGGGGYTPLTFPASALTSTVSVTVGVGGTAGAAGANGGDGGDSTFGSYAKAGGGKKGSTGASNGVGGTGIFPGSAGGGVNTSIAPSGGGTGGSFAVGGGSGGDITAIPRSGGGGGGSDVYGGSAGPGLAGTAGTSAASGEASGGSGGGGGGGGFGANQSGGAGAVGGTPGGGGGGGGAGNGSGTSGAGAVGGNGRVIVITYR